MSKFSSAPDSATTTNDEPPMVPCDKSFPMDLISEILSRLPVKSILRFKCVCKAWNALIMEPQFVKKHYRTANPSLHHVLAVSVERAKTLSLVDYSLHSLLSSSSSPPTGSKLDLDFEGYFFSTCITPLVGECHGMLYFNTTGTLYNHHILYNPFTRKLKELPFLERRTACSFFGFGYDHISDSYKVVAVSSHWGGGDEIDAAIHTLGTGSWRRFNPNFPTLYATDRCGIFVSGTLNWLSLCPDDDDDYDDDDEDDTSSLEGKQAILSLDLGTETFELLQLPDRTGDDAWSASAIGVLKGSLCIVDRDSKSEVNVWVMKDYGNRKSWTKLLRVPCFLKHPNYYYFITPPTLWISDECDEILLQNIIASLVIQNSKSHGINRNRDFELILYDQSLISPCF